MPDHRWTANTSVSSLLRCVAEFMACHFFHFKIASFQFASCKSEIVLPKLDVDVITHLVFVYWRRLFLPLLHRRIASDVVQLIRYKQYQQWSTFYTRCSTHCCTVRLRTFLESFYCSSRKFSVVHLLLGSSSLFLLMSSEILATSSFLRLRQWIFTWASVCVSG